MSLIINGNIFAQSGLTPTDLGSGGGELEPVRTDAGVQTRMLYNWRLSENGDFTIELQNVDHLADSIPNNMKDTQNLLRVATYLIESAMLLNVTKNGVGLLYLIKSLKKPDGTLIKLDPATRIKEDPELPFDINKLMGPAGFGRNLRLRNAVKDFNWGLLDRESAPFFFYREIETLAKIILGLDLEFLDAPQQWEEYYTKIGASQKERDFVKNVLKKRYADYARHGSYMYYTPDEFHDMLLIARVFLTKTLECLGLLSDGCRINDVDSLLKSKFD